MWKKTTHMGAGVAKNTLDGLCYIVVNYTPKGNTPTEYEENLPKFGNDIIISTYEKFRKIEIYLDGKTANDFFVDGKLPGWDSELTT